VVSVVRMIARSLSAVPCATAFIIGSSGLLPLAYGIGGTALYMAPTALVLGYGIIFATSLTLVLIPSLYEIGYDIGRVFQKKRG
jgi:Cu/Ag efflux pump CusA